MRSQLLWGTATLLMTMTIMAGGIQPATAGHSGQLAALAARQDLRDKVCIAMTDGHISRAQRHTLLADAKEILKPEEYQGFKRALDRLSPPKPVPKPHSTKVAHKKPRPTPAHHTPTLAKSAPALSIPADVTLPDRVVLTSGRE